MKDKIKILHNSLTPNQEKLLRKAAKSAPKQKTLWSFVLKLLDASKVEKKP